MSCHAFLKGLDSASATSAFREAATAPAWGLSAAIPMLG